MKKIVLVRFLITFLLCLIQMVLIDVAAQKDPFDAVLLSGVFGVILFLAGQRGYIISPKWTLAICFLVTVRSAYIGLVWNWDPWPPSLSVSISILVGCALIFPSIFLGLVAEEDSSRVTSAPSVK
jgi:hypothetical protein